MMLLGLALIVFRFVHGLGAVTNLTQEVPWGLWIGFDVVTGVAFAGGAYVLTFLVYILRSETYRPIVRATVLNGFLAYVFYAGALILDLGRPLHIVNPILGNSFGVGSVLFLVAWHFLLYMIAELMEFSPAVAEWLGLKRARKVLERLTLGAVIFGITLSTLHQSGLGALFLTAKSKIHPLWYTDLIPVLFLVSSVFAGLSMVIVEGSISHRVFHDRLDEETRRSHRGILLGLARICAGVLFGYLFLKLLAVARTQTFDLLSTPMGLWYLLEVLGFCLVPMLLFLHAVRRPDAAATLTTIRAAAVLTMIGVVLNRLNISIIAFKWNAAVRYVPSWMEIVVTLAIIFAEIWVLRWVILRMPVLGASRGHDAEGDAAMTGSDARA